ncbi:hypothetical protein HD554DRAFT_266761 [Boletus coccyginus]|nr:hypothetical protein HD554DRAFT_266761 [Boletus coccyginus]
MKNKTVVLAKTLPFPTCNWAQVGRHEMAIEPDELASCFIYQRVGALDGFLKRHGIPLNHIEPRGAA